MVKKVKLSIAALLFVPLLSIAQQNYANFTPVSLADIHIGGELKTRTLKNFDRIETERYTAEKAFNFPAGNPVATYDWPGDFEGRTMLGIIMEAQATHREPRYLAQMMANLPEYLNKDGYFGPVHGEILQEQQLAGNGWFLRALCEYYLWKKDPQTKEYLQRVIDNLILPTKGYHKDYPIDPEARKKNVGGQIGGAVTTIGKWQVSSDIGSNFIFLDGTVQAYSIIPSPQLKSVIDEMIARYLQMDLKAINAQTHASLSGMRGILSYYAITKDDHLLQQIKKRFNLYCTTSMTANYENFNWFGRPKWTEPCAIVDSYMVAVQLWKYTGEQAYLEDAHHIYYNSIANTQHANGGFGLNNCSIPGNNSLKIEENEAWWCCTMRGAEGLASAVYYNYFTGKNELVVPFFNTSEATLSIGLHKVTIQQNSGYPFTGKVSFKVLASTINNMVILKLAAPSWTLNHKLFMNGAEVPFKKENGFLSFKVKLSQGSIIMLTFDQETSETKMVNTAYRKADYTGFSYGPLLLGFDNRQTPDVTFPASTTLTRLSDTDWVAEGGAIHLSPVYHLMDPQVNKEDGYSKQILFEIKK